MSRNFRLIATAVAKDKQEYNYYYGVFKRVYSRAKNPGEYYLACAQLAEMFTKDKLEAVSKHFEDGGGLDDGNIIEEEARSANAQNTEPREENQR